MGVLNLWQILGPVKRHQELSELKGQVLAVDLSIWVCETQCVKQMQGVVSKPFLRNLFFRILHLLQLGVHLVFVVEGEAPDLKKDTMHKRQQDRLRSKDQGFRGQGYRGQGQRGGAGKGGRRNFNARLRECCRMLDCLGIPYLHSDGEAEAFCAALDAAGLVDGCLTNDGDAFLYGARTVYRNFTMNTKDPHVESYTMNKIESCLGLDRQKMVAMALLLGCDYLPKGVPGVGVDKAIKLMTTLQGYSILDRFHKWRCMSDAECVDQIESLVRKKALTVQDFPQVPVIDEFLTSRDKCPSVIKSWKRPQIADLQKFALDKMEWVVEYTLEKVLPLVTLWDMTFISKRGQSSERRGLLKPIRVVKARTRQGVQCYEVEWHKPETDTISPQTVYTTIETQDLFSKCYPEFVWEYDELMAAKKSKGKSTRKKRDVEEDSDVVKHSQDLDDDLSQAVSNLSLTTEPRGSPVKKGRIKEENVKLSTQQHSDSEDVKLNDLENNMAGLCLMLPPHTGNVSHTAWTSGHTGAVAPSVKIENVKSKVTPRVTPKVTLKVKADRHMKTKNELPDFTSDLSLPISRNLEEKLPEIGKHNGIPDINRGSEVSSQVMTCKTVTSTTDEECSDDEEQAYIPLSQRVQINLKKALNMKQTNSTKDKSSSIRPVDLDVSRLCTMLGSVRNLLASQQLSSQPAIMSRQPDPDTQTDTPLQLHLDTQTDTSHHPHPDTQTDTPLQPHPDTQTDTSCHPHPDTQTDTSHYPHPDTQMDTHTDTCPDTQTDRVCEGVEACLSDPITSVRQGVGTERDRTGSGQSCTLDTAQRSCSDLMLPKVDRFRLASTKHSVSRMSVKGVRSLKSRKETKCVKEQKLCMENQDLQHRKTLTEDENDKLSRLGPPCVVDGPTSASTREEGTHREGLVSGCNVTEASPTSASTREEDTHRGGLVSGCYLTEARRETCSVITEDSTGHNCVDSCLISVTEQHTYPVNVSVLDTKVTTTPSGFGVTCEQGCTVQSNLPDISQLSPCVSLSANPSNSPNCSQDLFNLTEFSCVEKIDFTISTPNLTRCTTSDRQMTCGDSLQRLCNATPGSNGKPLYRRHDNQRPVLVQETPCRTDRRVSFHQSVMDHQSFTASPHSMLDYDESLNMTGSKSMLDFGNFQIESSLLRSMDRGHQMSMDQSQDISGLGDMSHNHSEFVNLEKDDAQKQHIVLDKFETQRRSPVPCQKKTCVKSNYSLVLSTDTKSSSRAVQGHHDLEYNARISDEDDCSAGCVEGSADGPKGASDSTLHDVNKGNLSFSHQHKEQSPECQDNRGNCFPGYTGMDGSLGFTYVDDSEGDYCQSSSHNVVGDGVKLCDSVSLTNDQRTAGLCDSVSLTNNKTGLSGVGGQHSSQYCPDVTLASHLYDHPCSQTSEQLVSGHICEPSSGVQRRVKAMRGQLNKLDARLETKKEMTSHSDNTSPPSPVKGHMNKLDRRLGAKEILTSHSDNTSPPSPVKGYVNKLDRRLEAKEILTSHSDNTSPPSPVKGHVNKLDRRLGAKEILTSHSDNTSPPSPVKGHMNKLDRRLEAKENMTSHPDNKSPPSPVKGHVNKLDRRLEAKEILTSHSDNTSPPSPVKGLMNKLDRRLGAKEILTSHPDNTSPPSPVKGHVNKLDRRLEAKENMTSHSDNTSPPCAVLPSTQDVTDQLSISNFGEDSFVPTSSHNPSSKTVSGRTELYKPVTPVYKTVTGRTSPELYKPVTPAVNRTTNVTVEGDHSPVALADRLRARLRKASDRSVLGDITDHRHHLGTMESGK